MDVSFISLKLVLPAVVALVAPHAELVALIKPQFETRGQNLKKGIVRDPAVQAAVCDDIASALAALEWHVAGIVASPLLGGDGNHEFLIGAQRG